MVSRPLLLHAFVKSSIVNVKVSCDALAAIYQDSLAVAVVLFCGTP